jgi:hypothetical protein
MIFALALTENRGRNPRVSKGAESLAESAFANARASAFYYLHR